MTLPNLYLYSAPVHSGKTTALMAWAKGRTDLGGFLAPDLDDGLRYLLTLRDRQWHPFQVKESADEAVVTICRYQFKASAFALAHQTLLSDARLPTPWLVVDEVGKLELQGLGHEPALSQVVHMWKSGEYPGRLLLVVRSELLFDVVEKYGLHGARVLSSLEELAAIA
ncbi:MAG: hypothetical protein RMJ33_04075 [Saprospiraceae bacterium]|nr:hypothetical protein [Saprospiraceae bacterium]MDW8228994.1 hypothetical protein [Saprospiraceae bacterium]